MNKTDEKIVLCRPGGGLNDMLNQIEKCYQYCQKYKRKLYIDGSKSGFLDDFSNYFVPRDANISFEKIDFLTPPFDVFPKCLYNDLYNNELIYNKNTFLNTTKDGIPITFDFKKDYEEQILVHRQGGGVFKGILALARLNLKEDIKIHIRSIIEELKKQAGNKGKYYAIHVRNTDHKTDYKSYFNDIKIKLDKASFLCTDDYECQQYAKMFFGENVKSVTDIPDLSSCPAKTLHFNGYIDRYKTNVGTLTDLFILACAEKIYKAPVIGGFFVGSAYIRPGILSGYFILAKSLHENKRILDSLLYGDANGLLPYRFTLYKCQLHCVFTKIFEIFRGLFNLLRYDGILFTVRYILRYIFCKNIQKDTAK
jgi:hypothetical protein